MLKHILSAHQFFDRKLVDDIFSETQKIETDREHNRPGLIRNTMHGRIVATVFYEASTRTRFSFEAAAIKLGGNVITSENAKEFSSASKGEKLRHTIRVIAGDADIIVLRHFDDTAAEEAARISPVPIINGGDGTREHPTQALLDLYTIQKELGTIDNLTITLAGDLLKGRTIHSLAQMLAATTSGNRLVLASPEPLGLPQKYLNVLDEKKIPYRITHKLNDAIRDSDIVYLTRVQKERFIGEEQQKVYEQVKDDFIFDGHSLDQLKPTARLMHPMPIVNEITDEVELDPRAAFFRQADNGLPIRAALLEILNAEISHGKLVQDTVPTTEKVA